MVTTTETSDWYDKTFNGLGYQIYKLISNTFKTANKNPVVKMIVNVAIQQIILIAFQLAFTKQAKIADIKIPVIQSGSNDLLLDSSSGEWNNGKFYIGGVDNPAHPKWHPVGRGECNIGRFDGNYFPLSAPSKAIDAGDGLGEFGGYDDVDVLQ